MFLTYSSFAGLLFLLYYLVHFTPDNRRRTSLNFDWSWLQKPRARLNFRSIFDWTWGRIRRFRRDLILLFIFVTYTIHHLHFILFLLETKTEKWLDFFGVKNFFKRVIWHDMLLIPHVLKWNFCTWLRAESCISEYWDKVLYLH